MRRFFRESGRAGRVRAIPSKRAEIGGLRWVARMLCDEEVEYGLQKRRRPRHPTRRRPRDAGHSAIQLRVDGNDCSCRHPAVLRIPDLRNDRQIRSTLGVSFRPRTVPPSLPPTHQCEQETPRRASRVPQISISLEPLPIDEKAIRGAVSGLAQPC